MDWDQSVSPVTLSQNCLDSIVHGLLNRAFGFRPKGLWTKRLREQTAKTSISVSYSHSMTQKDTLGSQTQKLTSKIQNDSKVKQKGFKEQRAERSQSVHKVKEIDHKIKQNHKSDSKLIQGHTRLP